jgi:rhodanese-related sulfurtransferase
LCSNFRRFIESKLCDILHLKETTPSPPLSSDQLVVCHAIATISPQELADLIERGEVREIIDVRTPVEFREVHATVARNVPLDSLDPRSITSVEEQPLYFICKAGGRSAKACQKFIDAGIANVVSVDGGTQAWEAANLSVVRGRKTISLERQVRIAAGTFVLIGVALGYFVHPYFIGLSAFVGAGLVFAGVTNTCGLGMLLANMPWNKV